MTSDEIESFISSRYGELSSDEILYLMDVEKNPQIDHIVFENNAWTMWDNTGREFHFKKKNMDII